MTRIPERLQPKPPRTCRVQAYDDTGRLVHDLDLPAEGFHMVTGVREHDGAGVDGQPARARRRGSASLRPTSRLADPTPAHSKEPHVDPRVDLGTA